MLGVAASQQAVRAAVAVAVAVAAAATSAVCCLIVLHLSPWISNLSKSTLPLIAAVAWGGA